MLLARVLSPAMATALALLATIAPATASAHAGHRHAGGAVPLGPPAPLDSWDGAAAARDAHEQAVFQREVELTPPATPDGSCDQTRQLDGIGPACRTDDGLLRAELPGGGALYTHGPDFLDAATDLDPATTAPHIVAAVRSATKDDIACVPASTAHTRLVYAVPSDGVDRSTPTRLQSFRQSTYEASAVLDNASHVRAPSAGRRLRVLCDAGGDANVTTLRLRTPTAAATFATVRKDVQALLGDDAATPVRYLVYYDAHLDDFAGIGSIYTNSSTPTVANSNNTNLALALQDNSWGDGPRWDLLLHELSHNMGAVINGAPDSNGLGHCDDGLDVMCYEEGTGTYDDSTCPQLEYDCGGDSYYNPDPAGGSWLASHWNVASTANRFLQARTVTQDTTAPAAPTGLTGTGHGDFYRLAWSAVTASDVHAYRVEFSTNGAAWGVAGDSWPGETSLDASWPTIASASNWMLRVRAYDERGNLGAPSSSVTLARGSLGAERPAAGGPPLDDPTDLVVTATTGTSATLRWVPSGENATGFEIDRWTGTSWITLGWKHVSSPSMTVSGLPSGASWQLRVRALDGLRTSPGATITANATAATPSAPADPTVASSDGPVPTVTWSPAAGATGYEITTSPVTTTTRTTGTSAQVPRLAFATSYTISVLALGASGAASPAATTAFATPSAPDSSPPTEPGISFCTGSTTKTSAPASWAAASDNVAVTGYRVLAAPQARPWDFVRGPLLAPTATTGTVPGLRPGTEYQVTVQAQDAAGNATRANVYCVHTTKPDATPPTAPGAATASATGATSIRLAWDASSDDTGIDHYRIRRTAPAPAAVVASVPAGETTWDATDLDPETTYAFTIEAVDLGGNASGASPASATTDPATPDVTAPTAPSDLHADATDVRAALSWGAATDDRAVTGYRVYDATGTRVELTTAPLVAREFVVTGLTASTTYAFEVTAVDAAGNESAPAQVAVTTAAEPDTTPPGPPGTPVASLVTTTSLRLSWAAAPLDPSGIARYDVARRDGGSWTVVGTTTTALHADLAALTPGTTYQFAVRAVDGASNASGWAEVQVTTQLDTDTSPPGLPGGLDATASDDGTVQLTWGAASDDRGVVAYVVSRTIAGTTQQLTTTTLTSLRLTGQPVGTTVRYGVAARDAAGNTGGVRTVTVTIPVPPDPPPPPTDDGNGDEGGGGTTQPARDRLAPTVPGRVRVQALRGGKLAIGWGRSRDSSGIARYEVRVTAPRKRAVSVRVAGARAATTITRLPRGVRWTVQVRAIDGAGNASAWATAVHVVSRRR